MLIRSVSYKRIKGITTLILSIYTGIAAYAPIGATTNATTTITIAVTTATTIIVATTTTSIDCREEEKR
ncbi:hypothetical protein P8C59_000233 [Phyllachora maydis]|uniref:Uncharacterized protein n=1 Tax=Phyllachora maydis TaxID=1825666 RepID=A0AAD9HVG9_9PEZI|nr:hypothetical protein P8C59_000233 [Phyllachora maydis]